MKKFLCCLLSVFIIIAGSVNAMAINVDTVNFNSGDIYPFIIGGINPSDGEVTFSPAQLSSGDYAVKITSTTSNINISNSYMRYDTDVASEAIVSVSYDIMLEDGIQNGTSGKAFYMEQKLLTYSWDNKTLPSFVVADEGNTFGDALWESGKWYTVEYSVDCENKTVTTLLTDKETSLTQTAASAPLTGKSDVSGFDLVDLHPMGAGTIWIDNFNVNKFYNKVNIISPINNLVVGNNSKLILTAEMPVGYTSASVSIDGVVVNDSIDVGIDHLKIKLDVSGLDFGRHTVSVSAICGSAVYTDSEVFTLTQSVVNKASVDINNTTTKLNSGKTIYILSNLTNASLNNDSASGTFTYTDADKSSDAAAELGTQSSVFTTGIVEYDATIKFTDPAAQKLEHYQRYTSNGYKEFTRVIMENSKFLDGTECALNTEYQLHISIDLDNRKIIYQIDNNEAVEIDDDNLSLGTWISKFKYTASPGNTFVLSNYKFTLSSYSYFPYISDYSYLIAGEEVAEDEWADGKFSSAADSLVITFSEAITQDDISFALGYIEKSNSQDLIEAEFELDGNRVIITPKNGFEVSTDYIVTFSNIIHNGESYDHPLVAKLSSILGFSLVSPANSAVIEDKDIVFCATVPSDSGTPVFKLDGTPITMHSVNGKYTYTLPQERIHLGHHVFEVFANEYYANSEFEVVKCLANEITFSAASMPNVYNGNVEACTGSDDVINDAIKMTSTDSNIFAYFNCQPNISEATIIVEMDLKRDANTPFELEAVDRTGTTVWSKLGFLKPLISADGKIAGTSVVFPADEWHNLKVIQDIVNDTCEVYYDGNLVRSGEDDTGIDTLSDLKFQMPACFGSSLYFDNVKILPYITNPRLSYVSYEKDGAYTEAADNVISVFSDKIKLTMSEDFDSITAEDITINGESVSSVEASGNDIIITPASLDVNSDVVITFAPTLTNDGFALGQAYDIRLKTADEDVIGNFKISQNDNNASAELEVYKSKNSILPESSVIIIASYNGNKLTNVYFEEKSILLGKNSLSVSLDSLNGGTKVKAFLWSSVGEVCPMLENAE